MNKIKEILIHWLGGRTPEETADAMLTSRDKGVTVGKFLARRAMLIHAEGLYGLPAEEWCKKMYEYISNYEE